MSTFRGVQMPMLRRSRRWLFRFQKHKTRVHVDFACKGPLVVV